MAAHPLSPSQGRHDQATIDAPTLMRLRDHPLTTVVDVRPLQAFDGWRLGSERIGGHIPGAVAFPAAWLGSMEPVGQRVLIAEKGLLRPVLSSSTEMDTRMPRRSPTG